MSLNRPVPHDLSRITTSRSGIRSEQMHPQDRSSSTVFVTRGTTRNIHTNNIASSNDDLSERSSTDAKYQKDEVDTGDSDVSFDVEKQDLSHGLQNYHRNNEKDPNLVEWDGPDDPENPQNWSARKKWFITVTLGIMTFTVTFASSVFSTAVVVTSKEFRVGRVVTVLGTSLFVLGFAFGPLVWGPFSEIFGRKRPLFLGFFVFAIFNIPVAVAQNIETIMVCRFFGGFFASAPLSIIGGALADFFNPIDRGVAICVFAGATFIGPIMGPIMGGFVTMTIGWRWTQWLTLIMACFFGIIAFVICPETYHPILLQSRAKRIRHQTHNWAIHSQLDERQVDLREIAEKYLLRPFVMLFREPILDLMTIYMALIYGLIYLFFEAYPVTFQEQRGWNLGVGGLPFLGIAVGILCGCLIITYNTKTRFKRKFEQAGRPVPEERLIPMIIGGVLLPIGLFWFAWTSSPNITPWPQIIAGVPIGAGVLMIFMQGLSYIIDVYLMNANSAIAANALIRGSLGAGFPVFATAMFHNLGVAWATSLLGFLTLALLPVPVLFFIHGEKIRRLSRYSPTL